jgi:hypothetical protein
MANLVHNERVKLRATLFNTVAGSCVALGVLAPIVAAFYGLGTRPPLFWLLGGAIIWLAAAWSTAWHSEPYGGCEMIDGYTIAYFATPVVLAALCWLYELLAEWAENRESHAAE